MREVSRLAVGSMLIATIALASCGSEPDTQNIAEAVAPPAGLGTYWVGLETAKEYDAPSGRVVNRAYYRQQFTVYEKRGEWYRTVENGFTPRWSKASDLSPTEPAVTPQHAGPPAYRDARIASGAIPNPGQYGLTKRDVDTLWKGAKLTLQTEAGCSQITMADKSVWKPNTYYVTCRIGGGMPTNVFSRRLRWRVKTRGDDLFWRSPTPRNSLHPLVGIPVGGAAQAVIT